MGVKYLSKAYSSESERNSATVVRTRLLQCRSPAHLPLPKKTLPYIFVGTHDVIVIVVGNERDGPSSNPGQDFLHFTYR